MLNYKFFLNLLKNNGGHNFHNVNDRKKLSVVNVYIVFSDNAHIYTCIYNTCALSKLRRLRNGVKGEVFPRFMPNTHIYLYASTVHMYCIYPTGAWGMDFVSSSPFSLLPHPPFFFFFHINHSFFKIFIIIRFFFHLTISVDVVHHE